MLTKDIRETQEQNQYEGHGGVSTIVNTFRSKSNVRIGVQCPGVGVSLVISHCG